MEIVVSLVVFAAGGEVAIDGVDVVDVDVVGLADVFALAGVVVVECDVALFFIP